LNVILCKINKAKIIANNNIGDLGGVAICQALRENKSMKGLFISRNNICLCLDGNKLGDKTAKSFAEAIKENSKLEDLGLCKQSITFI
jgi:hypothetical protein